MTLRSQAPASAHAARSAEAVPADLARPTAALSAEARAIRDRAFANRITYSRKVFLPLTQLCRDVCHYCTFAKAPRHLKAPYMGFDEVLAVARAGQAAGCDEALFTLGERPEARYSAAADWLGEHGFASTIAYVAAAARAVRDETGLLPHINAGTLSDTEIEMLRPVSASMGLMLESGAERLMQPGMPHHGSPDKAPQARLATLRRLGEHGVPTTTGILIGIGETEAERLESLAALHDIHGRYGHIQEIIVQNFRAKPGTRMHGHAEPTLDDLVRTVAQARLLFGGEVSIQVPPNLNPNGIEAIVDAGIDDWGGISPVTMDFVNPEAPWPHVDELAGQMAAKGKALVQRLTIYPAYAREPARWLDPAMAPAVLRRSDAADLARGCAWRAGGTAPPAPAIIDEIVRGGRSAVSPEVARSIDLAATGKPLAVDAIERLFQARGADLAFVCQAADALRREAVGGVVSYVVTRNINYTNVCTYGCRFCAFSKGKTHEDLRGTPYTVSLAEVGRRTAEAWERGATEVCMQGGIHPDYTGDTYLAVCRAAKAASPPMHVHAFSPLEVTQGARTLGLPLETFLSRLKAEGLGTLPGTAAEILDDEVRQVLCPDKLTTAEWLAAIEAAHRVGLKTTATIMYGHVDRPVHWARHLTRIRALQDRTGGFTEFVPLPFVAAESPLYLKGHARPGPTFREAVLMHAVARIAFHGAIPNIQASWVKLGPVGVQVCLGAGVNDLGGTLMNESITRAAGAQHGQEAPPETLEAWIRAAGRTPRQRTTLYESAPPERQARARGAAPLAPLVNEAFVRPRRSTVGGRQ
ncbi:5-amino-6-(D-ribitylamino)uracil--L-tyrosine 4-hydroxyphenyl transferase CofH [Chelatococcus reniformis]|uniref:5-amino-6-(D-ribitylamino)uracil--L-tyrosine 4-hydroxyphenyl transferase CofH n=1 Tax=Chelatococcus reniformis TaxID=1494448 RepID=UPI001FCF0D79|nr:5-amino-6-(D-ribitylamino)uracil--L-tyrosine 4-hydroxyphenyl transferase CofH [Chelatococcus reniformis]